MMSKLAATKLFSNSSRKTVFVVNDSRCCRGSSPLKNSPYVGSFRHAPPSWATATNASELYEIILQETLHLSNNNNKVKTYPSSSSPTSLEVLKNLYVSGHLRGGSPSYSNKRPCPYSTSSFSSNHHHDFVSPMTLSLPLRRIVGWLLQPFHETMTPTIKYAPEFANARRGGGGGDGDASSILTPSSDDSRDDLDDDHDDDESSLSQDDYDDDSQHRSHSNDGADRRELNESTSDENDFHLSILSSQAEAYYAHTLTKDILNDQRLDYTITQMDVIRMMRNASRHLDVDSILQLPVTTYRSKEKQVTGSKTITITSRPTRSSNNEDESETEEMSWMLVHEDHDNKTPCSGGNTFKTPDVLPHIQEETAEGSDADVCVICLEHFVDGDRVRILPCTHSFHVGCIDRWLSGSHSFDDCVTSGCPTCKKRPVEEHQEDGADYTVDHGNSVPSWAFSRIGDALARNLSG